MTLAVLLLGAISLSASSLGAAPQSAAEPAPPTQTAPEKQDQTPSTAPTTQAAPEKQAPSQQPEISTQETKPATSTPAKPMPTHKRPVHKKKAATSDCGTLPTAPGSADSTATPNPLSSDGSTGAPQADPSSTANAATSGTAPPPAAKPCPPKRIVVSHGGTSEPSIHLAGGPNDQASHQLKVVNQLLGVTDANLKKIAGQRLDSNRQDTVTQIHQFMDQSKAAIATGDLDRARTLAWKAELLSEDLTKPQN